MKHIHDPKKDGWTWTLADPIRDTKDISDLANDDYSEVMQEILQIDYGRMIHCVTMAATEQLFNKGRELLTVARNNKTNKIMAFAWFDRGGYTTYSRDEISNQKFISTAKGIPSVSRVKLVYQALHQHQLWATHWGIPVLCSTSIINEHKTFIRIHEDLGYTVNGSYAYKRLVKETTK